MTQRTWSEKEATKHWRKAVDEINRAIERGSLSAPHKEELAAIRQLIEDARENPPESASALDEAILRIVPVCTGDRVRKWVREALYRASEHLRIRPSPPESIARDRSDRAAFLPALVTGTIRWFAEGAGKQTAAVACTALATVIAAATWWPWRPDAAGRQPPFVVHQNIHDDGEGQLPDDPGPATTPPSKEPAKLQKNLGGPLAN